MGAFWIPVLIARVLAGLTVKVFPRGFGLNRPATPMMRLMRWLTAGLGWESALLHVSLSGSTGSEVSAPTRAQGSVSWIRQPAALPAAEASPKLLSRPRE
ncbi:MAG: hypothetical protein LAP61_22960 [Acidobacteriia bacterium]|nr:hypothetical protein [Terriglobia bacterium]